MKKQTGFLLLLLGCLASGPGWAQEVFQECSAAFLDSKLVVDEYSPKGKCILSKSAVGTLRVQTLELTSETAKPLQEIAFRVAIKDAKTGTLLLFNEASQTVVDIKSLLAKCNKGDKLVLLTLDNRYSLPHNEILIQ